jgi:hypothetical protein
LENFDAEPLSWQSDTLPSVTKNSWVLGNPNDPNGVSGPYSGNFCWYTNITSTNAPHEQSWVSSPCYDFTDINRPMLKMQIWRNFNALRDGAVLQATTDSAKTWTNIGQLDDGINWFNEYQILGNPGNQAIGWSNIQDHGWVEARHSLDMLKGKSRVQFRIAYGSDGTARNTHGIAFDDFWIGDRNRIAIIEHFTNASDPNSKTADLELNNLVDADSLNTIDLQYHTSFPGADPFNAQEPYAPSARLLYYGLAAVPYSVLNGGYQPSYFFDYSENNKLDANVIQKESLLEGKFHLILITNRDNNNVNIDAQISAEDEIPKHEYTVHVGVVERRITGETGANGETVFENVVKALLPDASGVTLFKDWYKGEQREVITSWNMQNVYDVNQLRAFVFIQDESTHEIYQAAMDDIKLLTGIHDQLPGKTDNKFIVFPNPAADKAFIRFDKPVAGSVRIEMFNNLGSLVYTDLIPRTDVDTEIATDKFPYGLYIIRAISGNDILGTCKLNINR